MKHTIRQLGLLAGLSLLTYATVTASESRSAATHAQGAASQERFARWTIKELENLLKGKLATLEEDGHSQLIAEIAEFARRMEIKAPIILVICDGGLTAMSEWVRLPSMARDLLLISTGALSLPNRLESIEAAHARGMKILKIIRSNPRLLATADTMMRRFISDPAFSRQSDLAKHATKALAWLPTAFAGASGLVLFCQGATDYQKLAVVAVSTVLIFLAIFAIARELTANACIERELLAPAKALLEGTADEIDAASDEEGPAATGLRRRPHSGAGAPASDSDNEEN